MCPMWLYFAKEQGTRYVKIGITSYDDPVSAFVRFSVYNPREIQLLGLVKCTWYAEAARLEEELYWQFRRYSVKGDWFELPAEVIQDIRRTYKGPRSVRADARLRLKRLSKRQKRRSGDNDSNAPVEEKLALIKWQPTPECVDKLDHHAAVLGLPESTDFEEPPDERRSWANPARR